MPRITPNRVHGHHHARTVQPVFDRVAPILILDHVTQLTALTNEMRQPRPCATDDGRPAVLWHLPDLPGGRTRALIVAFSAQPGRFDVITGVGGRAYEQVLDVPSRHLSDAITVAVRSTFTRAA